MPPHHYDLIILGESLACQIAAAILARSGHKILLLGEETGDHAALPFPAGQHLQRLLEQFDGRDCLTPPPPRQVLAGSCRLTLHGSTPLAADLQREFTTEAEQAERLLSALQLIGQKLETALQESGGLPLCGLGSRWRFAWRRLRHGLTRRALSRPLSRHLQSFGNDSRKTLGALFAGLALRPPEQLTTAEAGLLWHSVASGPGIDPTALRSLLRRRFEQFRGERLDLTAMVAVQASASTLEGVVLEGGERCTADRFLLASRSAARHLPDHSTFTSGQNAPEFHATVTGGISSLLAPTITLGGSPDLLLQLLPGEETRELRISMPRGTQPPPPAAVMSRVEAVFPFAMVGLAAEPQPSSATETARPSAGAKAFPGATALLEAGPNLLLCSGEIVLPNLGPLGETLVGTTVAAMLLRSDRK